MDEKARGRQFWLRFLLVLGMLWGTVPFITTPFITRGANFTVFDIVASVFNSLTILPACVLAFWHRRTACLWLTVDGVLLVIALGTFIRRTGQFRSDTIVGVAAPIALALFLDYVEARRWPSAVNPRKAKAQAKSQVR